MDARTPALAAAALIFFCGLAFPDDKGDGKQQPSQSLSYSVVVTATRVETPGREVASSVTVITAEELARTGKPSVFEALRDMVGLSTLQNGGRGAAAAVSIRGANAEHTLVLLDGVELNDPINPSRSYDLAHLAVSQVERVEVLRGPQSPLYGSDALGGVINIITRKGEGRPRLSLRASGGTYGSFDGDLALSGAAGRADYAFGLALARTNGVSAASTLYPGNAEPDGYRNLSLSGRVGVAVRSNIDVGLTMRRVDARSSIDNFGGPGGDDPNSVQDYGSTLVAARARGLFLGGRWEPKLTVSWITARRDNTNPPDALHPQDSESGTYASRSARVDWQNNVFLGPSNTLTAGVDVGRERGRSEYLSMSAFGPYESVFPEVAARSTGFYVQDQWRVRDRLFLAAGARVDIHSFAGTALTYRAAPAYVVPGTGTRLKATLATGFKSPSLYQLFAPATAWGPIGNPGLEPERATGWDAGFDQDFLGGRFGFGATYFSNLFRNLIDFDYAAGYINVGRATTRGLEVSAVARPREGLDLRASYTRLAARDQTTGAELLRRPRDKFSADGHVRLPRGIDVTASVLVVGRRADRDFSGSPYRPVTLGGYALLDAAVSIPLLSSLEAFARFDNILDARYETVWGYGTPGFSVSAGFRLH